MRAWEQPRYIGLALSRTMTLPEPRVRIALLAVLALLLAGGILATQVVGDDDKPLTGPQQVDKVIDDVVGASRLLRASASADLKGAIDAGGQAEQLLGSASSRLATPPGQVPASLAKTSATSFEAMRSALASSRACLEKATATSACASQAKVAQTRSAAAGNAIDKLIPFGTRTPAEVVQLIQKPT